MSETVEKGPDAEVTLAEFPKNSREVVRVRRTEYQGRELLDLRVWYPDTTSGELRPGKGISLRLEQLSDLKKAIATAEKALKATPTEGASTA